MIDERSVLLGRYATLIDEGAVARAEVSNGPTPVDDFEGGVLSRDFVVLEDDVAVEVASDYERAEDDPFECAEVYEPRLFLT